LVTEFDGTWVATMFTANTHFQSLPAPPAFSDGYAHEGSNTISIDADEWIIRQ
jgi:hypothetical protein